MRGPTGLCQLAGRLVMAMIDVFRTLSCRGEGREVSALFAFRPGLLDATRGEKRGGWRDWVGLVLRGAEAFGGRIGPGDLGFAAWFSDARTASAARSPHSPSRLRSATSKPLSACIPGAALGGGGADCGVGPVILAATAPRLKEVPEEQFLVLSNQVDDTQVGTTFFATTADWINALRTAYCQTRDLNGVHYITQRAAQLMADQGVGRIVSMSSVSAQRGGGTFSKTPYSVAKAGLIGLTRSLARELGPFGVTVNALAPGPIDTEMLNVRTPEQKQQRLRAVPMKRMGTAEEVASLVLFLLSEESGYITGAEVAIDGGATL